MPRLKTTKTTAKRRIESSRRYYRRNIYDWVDPFPEIKGTSIEKMIYARLILMGIPFIFQGNFTVNIPEIDLYKIYRPDFILPDAKIIIDPFGTYWHSSAQAIEADSYKFALFQAMGYRVVVWWDYEIENLGLDVLFAREPELNVYNKPRVDYSNTRIPRNENAVDDLKGLRTMNARKRKPYRQFVGSRRSKLKKARQSYGI